MPHANAPTDSPVPQERVSGEPEMTIEEMIVNAVCNHPLVKAFTVTLHSVFEKGADRGSFTYDMPEVGKIKVIVKPMGTLVNSQGNAIASDVDPEELQEKKTNQQLELDL